MSAWSNIQAVLVRNGGTITLNNADISVETANDIKTRNFDAVGINNIGGTLTLTGDLTNIVVKQNAQYDTLEAETPVYGDDISAVGYLAIDTIATKDTATVTNFNAAKTSFDITNTVKDQVAAGIFSAANDTSRPQINVAGDLDITARSATGGTSIGLLNAYSDWNLETDPPINNPGHIKVNKNLTVDVTGGLNAFGLSSEIGDVIVDGSTYITAKVTDTKPAPQEQGDSINNPRPEAGAYGIYVTSNGHVTLNGKETVVTADKALVITKQSTIFDIDVNGQEWVPNTLDTSVSILSKTTTLNGTTSTEEGTKLYVANTVNFNGDADIQGQIMADADATLKIADGKTLTFGDSKNVESNTFKNLTLEGGTFNNASQMTVNGTLTLENIKAENLKNNTDSGERQSQIEADKVVFGNGATFRNKGSFHAKHWVFGEGSVFMEEENTWKQEDGTLRTKFSDYTTELAGGVISTIESNGAEKLAVIELVTDADAKGGKPALNNGVLMVTNGAYDFDTVTINISPDTQGLVSPKRFMVSGAYTTLNVHNFNATKGNASITDGSTFTVGRLKANGAFELDAQSAKSFTVKNFKGAEGGDFKLTGGTMYVGSIDLTQGVLTIGGSGTLATGSDQIFTNGLGADGKVTNAGGLKHGNNLVFEQNSSLTLNDAYYNFDYVDSAKNLLDANNKEMTVIFSGKLVDDQGNVRNEMGIDSVKEGTLHEQTDIAATATGEGSTVTIDKSVGGKTLVVDAGNKVEVKKDKTLTLVGTDDASGELINFKGTEGDKTVTATGEKGGVTLGSETSEKKGTLSATVELSDKATLTAQNGTFEVEAVKAEDAHIAVNSAELKVGTITANNTLTITGAVTTDKIEAAQNSKAVVNVGRDTAKGELTIANQDANLAGLTFFLDPAWKDGTQITDASKLIINKTAVDATLIAGQNSYFVLGSDNDAALKEQFTNGNLKWGTDAVTAAAYVAKPVTVKTGALLVDGSLTEKANLPALTAGSVKFAANSALVADVSGLAKAGDALITANTITIDDKAKAVVVGLTKDQTFKLTSTDTAGSFFKDVVSGNKMWNLTVDATNGKVTSKLGDASIIYGDLMQGQKLANAGMLANNAWVDGLLTDVTDTVPLADVAARFDAAMNTAGAAAVFTTAYDRASEFREAVRGEAGKPEANRLWAQVTGGKTKLKGISTGAQTLDVDTDAYGLVVGGDIAFNNAVVGAAFTAGSGDSENDAVGVKDDFNFYGLSVYGKTAVGAVDLLADASMTFVKSDLTMGGVADVDTDTTTAVYSIGVQAQRTWDFGVEFTPFVGMDVYHVRADGYDNGHGASVEDADATAVEFPIGVKVAKAFDTNGFKVSPDFSFAVVPTVGDRDIDSKVRFAGAESTYNFTFADDVKIRTNLGVAAEKDNFRFGLNAGYDWGNEERSATKLMLNARYLF